MGKRKTIEVSTMVEWVNTQLARTDDGFFVKFYMPDICNSDEYLIWLKEFGYFTDENYIKKVNDIKEYEESLYN